MHRNQRDPEYPKEKGKRLDGRDLIQEWIDKHPNSQYVWNQTGFDQIDVKKVDHVIGMLWVPQERSMYNPSNLLFNWNSGCGITGNI